MTWKLVVETEKRFDIRTGEPSEHVTRWIKGDGKYDHVALVHTHKDAEARSHLLAAAPELLSALKDLFQMMDEQILVRNTDKDHLPGFTELAIGVVTRLKFAHDAIAKAEGRSA